MKGSDMDDFDESFEGKTIPKEYWNMLVEWKVHSPYDGCFYKYSQAFVDGDGNLQLMNSKGRDINDWMEVVKSEHGLVPGYKGLYDHSDGWNERMLRHVITKHGFKTYNPSAEVANFEQTAVEKVFGTKWYNVKMDDRNSSKELAVMMADPRKRLKAYEADMADYDRRRQERLNALFMGALLDETPDKWKLYPLDAEHVLETCKTVCHNYSETVAIMCGILDTLAEAGYDVWCKCSDCGKMFQLQEMEKFQHLIDTNAYTGDNGIGLIYKRVLCEDCKNDVDCPQCHEPTLPNPNVKGVEGHEYDHYTFAEAFVSQWIGVCHYCSEGFFSKSEYKHWEDELGELETTIDDNKAQLEKYLGIMKEGGMTDEELKNLREKNTLELNEKWRVLVNEMREKMDKDVEEYFSDANDWHAARVKKGEKYFFT